MAYSIKGVSKHVKVPVLATGEAVVFDGANDRLEADFSTSVSDGKRGIFSCWFRLANKDKYQALVGVSDSSDSLDYLMIKVLNTNEVEVVLRGADYGTELTLKTTSQCSTGTWYHVVASWDLTQGLDAQKIFLNDSEDGGVHVGPYNIAVNYTCDEWVVGDSKGNSNWFDGDMAELYFNLSEYLDIGVLSNRRKFISGSGTGAGPVELGSDGSIPTGNQPEIYVKGNAAVWNAGTNSGTAGDFTMSGTVADSANEPVELA